MRPRPGRALGIVGAAVGVAITASENAKAEEPATSIWYRSAEGCPDGEAFVAKLEARNVRARLAHAGDAIDFVVTLGSDETGATGSLERQTRTGTVAVRRVEGDTCDQVADALALSMVLSRDSNGMQDETSTQDAVPTAKSTESPAAQSGEPPAIVNGRAPVPDEDGGRRRRERSANERATLRVGAQANAVTGVAPMVLPGASLFLELEPARLGVFSRPAFRLTALGAMASGRAGGRDIRAQLIESRFEGCPVRVGGETADARPCIAFEIGEIETTGTGETGRSDAGVWSTAGAGLRLSWVAASALLVEAQVFGTVPLKRYELVSGEPPSVLYRTALLGLSGAIGAAFQLP